MDDEAKQHIDKPDLMIRRFHEVITEFPFFATMKFP